jgi:hypothetical protein
MKRLLKVLFVVAIVAAIAKLVMMKQEWAGFTEAQVRDKLDAGLARKVEDAEKRKEIADKVVATMREQGVIRDDDESLAVEATDVAEDVAEALTDAAADAADAVQESIDDVKEAG